MSAATPTISRAPRSNACAQRRQCAASAGGRPQLPRRCQSRDSRDECARTHSRASRPRRRFARCRRRSWSRRPPAAEPLGSGSVAAAAALCRQCGQRPEPPDAAGRHSAHRARSICVPRWPSRPCATSYVGRRRRAVDGEVDVPRGAAEVSPSKWRSLTSSRRCARGRFARLRPWGGARARGRRRRPPWPCRRAAHRWPRADQACALFGSACTASSRSEAASLALSIAR